jgi:hypothetical protein
MACPDSVSGSDKIMHDLPLKLNHIIALEMLLHHTTTLASPKLCIFNPPRLSLCLKRWLDSVASHSLGNWRDMAMLGPAFQPTG